MNTTPHGSPRPANRLAAESSPYLLQHAHNPVDWWPWGDAAFTEARRRNVPILLSIGYSTCHWCHVMERECFDNEAIAALLNASFVCIKVDREERPAVDDAYMAATMMLSGHGGWPMTVFLEPTTLAPFWAGTYFPPEPRPEYGNRPSLPQVVEALNAAWRDRRAEVLSQADQVAKAVREHLGAVAPQAQLGQNTVADAVSQILQQFDRVHGGFGAAPKFPQPVYIDLLAAVRARAADDSTADALDIAVRNSLNAMAVGGIFDQIGGGFHRYSVDASWTIPHFEKMLYDQALLAPQYARAARAFGDPYFEEIARRTLGFVRSTLKGPHGAFLSALDADTNGREGLTYTWTAEEFRSILGEDADHALRFYGLSGPPNFKDPHHPEDPAVHLPRLAARPEHLAPGLQMGPAEFSILRHSVNDRLLATRSTRPQPFLDDKVIASWNGLAIAAFAECGMEFEDASLIAEASAAADAALSLLRGPDGSLARTWRNGTRSGDPALEDYAAMMKGLLAIAAADAGQRHARTEQALRLFAHAKEHYHDSSGAWFDAPDRAKELFVRPRSTHDGAVPCGCSMMLHNLIDLHELSGAREPLDLALKGIGAISGALAAAPAGASNGVRALFRLLLLKEVPPGEAPPPAPSRHAPLARSTVEVYAGVERMSLAPDIPAKTSILVRIAPGTHLAAADAGGGAQQPFRIDVIGGSGVAVYADYPPGKPFEVGGHPMRIYEGEFELPIVLEREGEWKGRPLLCLRFQACTSIECLPPMIYELDIALDAVG